MPHVGGSSAEDLASSDEIKVFASEEIGDEKDEKGASADLTDLKSNLITECNQVSRLVTDVGKKCPSVKHLSSQLYRSLSHSTLFTDDKAPVQSVSSRRRS